MTPKSHAGPGYPPLDDQRLAPLTIDRGRRYHERLATATAFCMETEVQPTDYCYLLGVYLGDGCLNTWPRRGPRRSLSASTCPIQQSSTLSSARFPPSSQVWQRFRVLPQRTPALPSFGPVIRHFRSHSRSTDRAGSTSGRFGPGGLAARPDPCLPEGAPPRPHPLGRLQDHQPLQDQAAQRTDRRLRVSALLLFEPLGRHPGHLLRALRPAWHPLDPVEPTEHLRVPSEERRAPSTSSSARRDEGRPQVRAEGLEPPQSCDHEDLNLARLPDSATPACTGASRSDTGYCHLHGRHGPDPSEPGQGGVEGHQGRGDPPAARQRRADPDDHARRLVTAPGRPDRVVRLRDRLRGHGVRRQPLEPGRASRGGGAGDPLRSRRGGRRAGLVRPRQGRLRGPHARALILGLRRSSWCRSRSS